MIIRDNSCKRLLLAVPQVDQRIRETDFYILIFRRDLFQTRRGIIDNRDQRISDHNRYLTVEVITTATIVMAPGTIINNHILLAAAVQQLPTFCSLQMSISSNNNNSYILHKYHRQLHNRIILVYFQLLVRLRILTFHLRIIIDLFHLVWVISDELLRVRGLIVERNCGELWGRKGLLRLLGG